MENFFRLSHIEFVFDMFRSAFGGIEWFVVAYLFCIAVFFIIGRQSLNLAFVYPDAFMAVTIFNPFVIVPLSEVIGLTTRMRRLFWLLPVNLVLSYAFTGICMTPPRKSYLSVPPKTTHVQEAYNILHRSMAAGCCVLFIALFGSSALPHLHVPQNLCKADDTVVQISELIEEDAAANGLFKKALYANENLLELRQYNPSILGMLRRSDMTEWSLNDRSQENIDRIIRSYHQPHILALVSRFGIRIDEAAFIETTQRCRIDYIIQEKEMELGDYYVSTGYELIGEIGEFEIYHRTTTDE